MEAIIFIQKKRELQKPIVEPVGAKSYLLIRVYLEVSTDRWFGRNLREPMPPYMGEKTEKPFSAWQGQWTKKKWGLGSFLRIWDGAESRRQRKQALQQLQSECEDRWQRHRAYLIERERWQAELEQTRAEILTLKSEIHDLISGCDDVSVAYGDAVRHILVGYPKALNASWLTYIWNLNPQMKEFDGYGKLFWCTQFLPDRPAHHFVILGSGEALLPVLEIYVRRMKSLRWYLRERNYSERLMELVDTLCEEWGLTPEIHILNDWVSLQREGLKCPNKSCILDFSKDMYLSAGCVSKGSLWLDVYAVEQKRQQLEQKCPHITYYSLKKTWEKLQKRCNCAVFP